MAFQEGVFEVSAKFMGVDMERVELDLQELLRLQYEGQVGLHLTSAPLHHFTSSARPC